MVAPSMTKRQIQADFLTCSYRIVGEIHVGRAGISSLLNDDSTLVDVYSANMARAHQPTKLVDRYKALTLVKSEIVTISLKRKEDVGSHTMGRAGYEVTDQAVWLTTSMYEIQGVLQWAGHFDIATLLAEGGRAFIPLYDVKITHILVPGTKM